MAQNQYPATYLNMAPLYTSSAVERAVGQGTKFALENLKYIIGNVNLLLETYPARDVKGRVTVALTAAEYYINFIRFSVSASTGSPTLDAIELAQSNMMKLEERLSSAGPPSEESEARARRTESCFRDVLSWLEERRRPRQGEAKRRRARTGAQATEFPEPMLRSSNIFESEADKKFMLRLRQLHLRSAALPPTETLQQLYDLCQLLRPDTITLSEVMTDTALRSVIIILFKTKNQVLQGDTSNENVSPNVCDFLKSCFEAMNQPAHLQWKEEKCVGYKNYVRNRKCTILSELAAINSLFMDAPRRQDPPPVPAMEASPSVPPSALWRRLQSVESLALLMEGKEDEACAICREEVFCRNDFGILSSCPHLFCSRCIAEWFKSKSTCPICRALTTSWTTKKHFEDSKNRSEIVSDTEPPTKRQRRKQIQN